MPTLNKTTAEQPNKTSNRKRPNRAFIEQMAGFRGYMTGNEKVQLATLQVKNAMARINTRAMSDDVNDNFNTKQTEQFQKLIKQFVKDIDAVTNS